MPLEKPVSLDELRLILEDKGFRPDKLVESIRNYQVSSGIGTLPESDGFINLPSGEPPLPSGFRFDENKNIRMPLLSFSPTLGQRSFPSRLEQFSTSVEQARDSDVVADYIKKRTRVFEPFKEFGIVPPPTHPVFQDIARKTGIEVIPPADTKPVPVIDQKAFGWSSQSDVQKLLPEEIRNIPLSYKSLLALGSNVVDKFHRDMRQQVIDDSVKTAADTLKAIKSTAYKLPIFGEATKYRQVDTGAQPDAKTTYEGLDKGRYVKAEVYQEISDGKALLSMLDLLDRPVKNPVTNKFESPIDILLSQDSTIGNLLEVSKGKNKGLFAALSKAHGKYIGFTGRVDPNAKAFDIMVAVTERFKKLGGITGVMATADTERLMGLIVTPDLSREVAVELLKFLRGSLNRGIVRYYNLNTGTGTAEMDKAANEFMKNNPIRNNSSVQDSLDALEQLGLSER